MKPSRAIILIVGYAGFSLLFGLVLIKFDLPDQTLALLLVPVVAASVNYPRYVYLLMALIFMVAAAWVTHELAIFFGRSLETVTAAFFYTVGTCEVVAGLAKRRRRAEEALRESERRYRELFENANDIVYTHDLEGRLTSLNKAGERIIGHTREEALQLDTARILPQEYRDLARKMMQQKLSDDAPTRYDLEIVAREGRRVSLEVSTRLIYENGKPVGVQGIARDITDRKRAEAETARLAAAVEHAAESILITDAEGTIQYVNPAFERVTGYSRHEVLGKNPRLLKSGKHDEVFYRRLWRTLKKGGVWSGRFTNKKKDGTLYEEEATISPIYDPAGRITNYVAVKRDITQELALEGQLRHAQKMEAVGQLAGGVAHDFNNLLQAIQGYAALAMKDLDPEHKAYRRIGEVMAAADRGALLVRKLLTFSRREAIHPTHVDLNKIVGGMMEMLRRVIGEHIELQMVPGHELKAVYADSVQIEQILLNLCVNARDAMPGGGRVVIETEAVTLDKAYCQHHPWAIEGEYVRVTVSDTGPGLPAEIKEHIFEPFFTTKDVGKGTGLGLATVYGIVKQHGGLIHVYSESGEGTAFKIYFPVAESKVELPETPPEEMPVIGGSECILVAEDEEFVRDVAVQILEDAGYRVLAAHDGEDAMAVFERYADEIDLALVDVVMPRASGRAVYDRIMALRPNTPVLFCSGYSLSFNAHKAGVLPEEECHLIQKPYRPNDLLVRVRQLLDTRQK